MNMRHCGTSTFGNHLNYRFIVLKDVRQSTGTRMSFIGWNVINVCWHDVGVLALDVVVHVWVGSLQRVSPKLFLGLFNLICQAHRRWPGIRHNPVIFFLFLHPFRHRAGAAYQAEILGTASGAEMASIEQMKKIVPLITCEIPFSQHVCEMVLGVNVTDLNLGVQINPVKQPIQSNSVGA